MLLNMGMQMHVFKAHHTCPCVPLHTAHSARHVPACRLPALGVSRRYHAVHVVPASHAEPNGDRPNACSIRGHAIQHCDLPRGQCGTWEIFLTSALRTVGSVVLLLAAIASSTARPALAHASETEKQSAHVVEASSSRRSAQAPSYRYTGLDLAAAEAPTAPTSTSSSINKDAEVEDARLQKKREVLEKLASKGVPVSYDELMQSMVYDPSEVPNRLSKPDKAEQLSAIMNQYDAEDFDLGIKQFMIQQQIEQELEDNVDKKGGNVGLEEKLAAEMYANEDAGGKDLRTEDIVDDAFTTEAVEEYLTVFGEPGGLQTAWRVVETLRELSYTQFLKLVSEGHVDAVRFFGPEKRSVMVQTRASAPGGAQLRKVVVAPDPDLFNLLTSHGVKLDTGVPEAERLHRSFAAQVMRYTFPFMFISGIFWVLHTWLLDPMPNGFRRQEFLRYRRELMHVASKLNYRSPAREVHVDTSAPDFIPWDEIHGIDEVKKEILEIIEYLRNPALLRARGVARIGGVLLAGSPGTGKTLIARAIAAESGVRMFTCSGTDFYDVYTGVGPRRIRETFEKLRNHAPAILFIDEFDALGAARGASAGGDESASIINEMLVQMDGFEDNRGIVVLGATNRPGAIDAALIRPGRFDRIIYMPLPDAIGRAKIMQVHARNKRVDPSINWYEVARAMAGFTPADCMGLMQRSARMAARQGRDMIGEEDIYAAMENKALEAYSEMSNPPKIGDGGVPDPIPDSLKRAIAVYEAGKALVAYITPEYEEIARVSVCPQNLLTGYTLFVEDENRGVNSVLTRSEMEAHMVVHLAGRCAERLVVGEGEMTGMGVPDMYHANMIAREMVLTMGMGKRMGPVNLMHVVQNDDSNNLLTRAAENADEDQFYYHATDMSTEQARVAMADVQELLEAAEAKACYGLAVNWKPLQALVQALLDRGVVQGRDVARVLESNGVIHFPDPYTAGFSWGSDGKLEYPFKPKGAGQEEGQAVKEVHKPPELTGVKAKTWFAGTEHDAPRGPDGKFVDGWHWNMPYTVKQELPEFIKKEVERYGVV